MSNPYQSNPAREEAIEATAAAWLAQRDAGLTPAEAAAFERWRQADARHAVAVARLEAAWAALQQLRDYRPEAAVHPDRDLLGSRRAKGKLVGFPVRPVLALAAAAAVVMTAFWWWPRVAASRPASPVPVYATTSAGYQRVVLEDGSVLELNASSAVRVEFTPALRQVRLLRGEGYFTVAKNPVRPFVVSAGRVAVRAVGTAFNVRLGGRDVEVLVTEGKVKVDPPPPAARSRAESLPGSSLLVTAGQRILLPIDVDVAPEADERPQAQPVAPEVIRTALAWQGPRLRFVDTPLGEVIAQFNRHNRVQLELGDPGLAVLQVDGSFLPENVEAFVRLLEASDDITIERPDDTRIVLRRRPPAR